MSADIWEAARQRAAAAHAGGAMYRIESEPFLVADGGVNFVVRLATDYAGQAARQPKGRPGNPFADPEPELFVGEVSPTHIALLNKYHVIESHLLLVTRAYVDQDVLLDPADFDAMLRAFPAHAPAMAFYNGGSGSGASQAHKHLQLVSLPLAPWADIPIAPLLEATPLRLPFRHAFARVGMQEAAKLHQCYRALLAEAGIEARPGADGERQSGPYSLLVTRDWMLVVPRSREAFEGASINSLAYAGALFVRYPHQLDAVRSTGPMAVLAQVAA
jgi:sulfate adenylyltransferase (ADP) / ATP adenylyltransferase